MTALYAILFPCPTQLMQIPPLSLKYSTHLNRSVFPFKPDKNFMYTIIIDEPERQDIIDHNALTCQLHVGLFLTAISVKYDKTCPNRNTE
ncbi:hypothetical protein BpHYR1_047492 [Brachionus plicatilis]|uniref:Uncharacterized protein n=1 Tax=Brachionus plicatilis TaxID=10195 RepID=A0A3M7QEY9_BRAPC|nr:hypothetical protein BpHYR1_047492 [Brachionus plicatilis]